MTAMSRKFYVALAKRFEQERPADNDEGYKVWVSLVIGTASVISEGNPSFDRARFLTASGLPDKAVSAYA